MVFSFPRLFTRLRAERLRAVGFMPSRSPACFLQVFGACLPSICMDFLIFAYATAHYRL
nr:MAG TPA: hypothetical protein [Caudoviricetes sp.]